MHSVSLDCPLSTTDKDIYYHIEEVVSCFVGKRFPNVSLSKAIQGKTAYPRNRSNPDISALPTFLLVKILNLRTTSKLEAAIPHIHRHQRPVVEDDVGRHVLLLGQLVALRLQRLRQFRNPRVLVLRARNNGKMKISNVHVCALRKTIKPNLKP